MTYQLDKPTMTFYTLLHNSFHGDLMRQSLFLKAGDHVVHNNYPLWGVGVVTEERTSTLSGGVSIVRVSFRDGVERCFMNDLNDYNCCYYAGVRRYEAPALNPRGRKF